MAHGKYDSERPKKLDTPQSVIATPDLIRGRQSQEIALSLRSSQGQLPFVVSDNQIDLILFFR
jgi:hypothetical protein